MTMILTDRAGSPFDAVKSVGAQAGNSTFAVLATLLLASILSLMALPSVQQDSAIQRFESASALNDQNGESKTDLDKVLWQGTPEPPMANRSFGPDINFRLSGTTRLASDTHITNCYSETFDRCVGIIAHAPGLH